MSSAHSIYGIKRAFATIMTMVEKMGEYYYPILADR